MSLSEFLKTETVIKMYLSDIFQRHDMTLAELVKALQDPALVDHVGRFTLGQALGRTNSGDQPGKLTYAQQALKIMKAAAEEWHSAHDMAEQIGTSAPYLNGILKKGIEEQTLPIACKPRSSGAPGRPEQVYRYVADLDPNK